MRLLLAALLLACCACASNQAPISDGAWFVYAGPGERHRVDLFVQDTGYVMREDSLLVGRLGLDLSPEGPTRSRIPLPLWLRPATREPGTQSTGGPVVERLEWEGRQVLVVQSGPGLRAFYHPLTGFLLGWERDGSTVKLESSNTTAL